MLVLALDSSVEWAFHLIPWTEFALYFVQRRIFYYNSLVLNYRSCNIGILQYKWNYVNSKSICAISLFISPILDLNWWSDLIVKDCQHQP